MKKYYTFNLSGIYHFLTLLLLFVWGSALAQDAIVLTLGMATNPTTCSGTDGKIAFTSTGFTGSQTLSYKKDGTANTAPVTIASDAFELTGLGAGEYTDFAIGATTATGSKTLTNPASCAFITRWDLSKSVGSGATQLSFDVATSGTVSYTWQEVGGGGASGSGTFSASPLTITGLPTNGIIDLSISPANFQRIIINNGIDRLRLTDVKQWGNIAWTSMEDAFNGCDYLNISATDVPNLSGVSSTKKMFTGCIALNGPSNIGTWNVSAVTNMEQMFYGAIVFNQNIGAWNVAAVTNMISMFGSANAFNQNIGAWDVAAVTNMSAMFHNATAFNQNIGAWDVAAVTDMRSMFSSATAFNQNIGAWDVAAVTTMNEMFYRAAAFNQNIGAWNTSKVTNMTGMFVDATAFNQDIGAWNVAAVTIMRQMFVNTSSFDQNISAWNVSAVTDMAFMFYNATAFNQNIGAWNVATVTDMWYMFSGASAFNQSLAAWGNKLKPSVNLANFLNNCGMNVANYDATLTGFNSGTVTGRTMGAAGLKYCAAEADRANLVLPIASGGKGWTITSDVSVVPTLTLGTIPAICAGAMSFTIPYTASTGTPTTYSISGVGITTVTDGALPSGSITVSLSAAASGATIPFTLTVKNASGCSSADVTGSVTVNPAPTLTLGTIPAILAGATSFTIPYTATTGSPTTYSISGAGFTTVTDAALPSSPITVNLSAPASIIFDFTLTVKNASGCTSLTNSTGSVIVNTPITQACATATFTGTAPFAPTATTAGVGGRGGIHTYTVPAGVTAIRIDARGAKGGSTTFNGGSFPGGKGGRAVGTFAVTPGDVLHILVAGKGGDANSIAGGENPGEQRTAAGGGGATIVSNGPIGSGTLLLVGAGGGGAGRLGGGGTVFQSGGSGAGGGGNIGAGGASVTANGANSTLGDINPNERDCGEGGKAAGNGGAAACSNRLGTNGGGYGGGGAGNYSTPNGNAGGGGGAGYTGGGGGGLAGGNAGTNYVNPSATNALAGETDLDAAVVITIAATISYAGSPFCKSLTTTAAPTITGYTGTGGIFSSTAGLTIDATTGVINPSTSTAGTYTVSYTPSVGCTAATTTVTMNAQLTITAGAVTNPSICGGTDGSIAFTTIGLADGSYTLNYKKGLVSLSSSINVSANVFILSGLMQGSYSEFSINNAGCIGIDATNRDLAEPPSPSVTISSNLGNFVASGAIVAFTATPTNGGSNPFYQWKKNGNNVGTNINQYIDAALNSNDQVWCLMTSNDVCASPVTATSNVITINACPTAVNWTNQTVTTNQWLSVAYGTVSGNGLFVAVGNTGANRVMTSPDGITWTARTAVSLNTWQSVTYGNGLFVAVARDSTYRVMTSPDGINWTARIAAAANDWQSVTYGNGLFVAVARNSTNQVMTSPDGINWTTRIVPSTNEWWSVTYGNGLFVAVARNGSNQVMSSPDGINWTARTAAAANEWQSVSYGTVAGNPLFVAVSSTGTNRVMTSPDGITWTTRTTPTTNQWRSVTYGIGLFVAVADDGVNRVMTSPDGMNWTSQLATQQSPWLTVTYGNGMFVAVAPDGTKRVMTSGYMIHLPITTNISSGSVSYTAGTIIASNQVTNSNVTYTASQSVTLLPGFEASTTTFKAQIAGCPN